MPRWKPLNTRLAIQTRITMPLAMYQRLRGVMKSKRTSPRAKRPNTDISGLPSSDGGAARRRHGRSFRQSFAWGTRLAARPVRDARFAAASRLQAAEPAGAEER